MKQYQFQAVFDKLAKFEEARIIQYPKHQYIYLPSDLSRNMYVLAKGAIKVGSYASSGQEVTFDSLLPYEFFGNLQFLEGDFFTEFSKTLVSSEVLEIPVNTFKELMQHDEEVSTWFHKVSTMRWWRAENRLFLIASEKPEARMKQILSMLEQDIVDLAGRHYTLTELLTYQDVADLSGLSRQSVARLHKTLFAQKKAGQIKISSNIFPQC
ncbi:Crp/Fnr family transcriptional regulator [Porifericola rhodea]|uniref:Crp/Fnr family transcriptional regulator n=1 Tax=Porifericola rhodea TaxID=930972 RepID=UPI002665E84F|nr:Crp/Fnr family transcriptional regulator [Porifericola rhodea]WKN32236.1 Crp/Fnr family transcriptional regulator [Porifericola rhodea]